LFDDTIYKISTWLVSFVKVFFNLSVNNTSAWMSLFVVCFAITFVLRRFVVEPMGFYISEEGAPGWELAVLLVLVLGFYIYMLNQNFDQPMPETWPKNLLKLLDGYKHTYTPTATSIEERNTWLIVPYFWTITPLAFMYFRTKLRTG
jgi:hypothetical protein